MSLSFHELRTHSFKHESMCDDFLTYLSLASLLQCRGTSHEDVIQERLSFQVDLQVYSRLSPDMLRYTYYKRLLHLGTEYKYWWPVSTRKAECSAPIVCGVAGEKYV